MRSKPLIVFLSAAALIGLGTAVYFGVDRGVTDPIVPSSAPASTVPGTSVGGAEWVPPAEPEWVAELERAVAGGSPPPSDEFDAVVEPGESIQEAVDGLAEGSTIKIAAGVHLSQQVKPKDGMTFAGEPGSVMDGEGTTRYAFVRQREDPANNVTIRSLEIRNYMSPPAHGAIHAPGSSGWVVEDSEVHHNSGAGVNVADGSVIRGNYLHHNERIGLKARGDVVLIEDNEISFNNFNDASDPNVEAGGMKFGTSDGVVIRNNHVHDNHGHGIWADIGAIHSIYEGNLIEDNLWGGINHEISYDAVIRDNTIRENGHGDPRDDVRGGGIQIKGPNVQVYDNVLERNKSGVVLIENDRGSGEHGSYDVANIDVFDNTFINSGQTGGDSFSGQVTLFESSRFEANEYHYEDLDGRWWRWEGANLTWDEWKSIGHDGAGALTQT